MLEFPGQPYAHQKEVIQQTWDKPYYAYFWEMGTGKSYTAITVMLNLYLAGKIDTVLYVAKKGELSNFSVYEVPKYWPERLPIRSGVYSGYTTTKHVEAVKKALEPFLGLRLYSINIEALRSEKPFAIAQKFLKTSRKTMIIVDESTTLKDPKSVQTKALMQLRKICVYARIMTGTVIPHSPVDVWSQARFLSPYAMPGYASITSFKSEFLITEIRHAGPRKYLAVLGPKNLTKLNDLIRSFASVLTKKDCLDLPEKIYKPWAVELTPMQRKLYDELVDYSIAQLGEEDFITGVNALAVATKLHQIVCGQVRMEDGSYRLIENNRYQATADICSEVLENEPKIIVWSHFVATTQALAEFLTKKGFGVVHMPGGLSIEERQKRIDEFKTSKEAQIFLANPQSSGFGLTLTEAKTAIYFSNSDNYEHRLQSEDRIHRIGQTEACLYIDLQTPDTVESRIFDRNSTKGFTREAVMGRNDFIRLIRLTSE